jgi:hypothetical protein
LNSGGDLALLTGLESDNEEVRFYAAEALAYLDNSAAAPVLAQTARKLPAFRLRALKALGAMDDPKAYDELSDLLHVTSAETRYGAFRALADLSPDDPQIAGKNLAGILRLHIVSSITEPMVHITREQRPEIVLFGAEQELQPPILLFGGTHIMVKGDPKHGLVVTRHATDDEDDVIKHCPARLDDLIPTLVQLGASYPDVIQAIEQAARNDCIASRVVYDALPEVGRKYYRHPAGSREDEEETQPSGGSWPADSADSHRFASADGGRD